MKFPPGNNFSFILNSFPTQPIDQGKMKLSIPMREDMMSFCEKIQLSLKTAFAPVVWQIKCDICLHFILARIGLLFCFFTIGSSGHLLLIRTNRSSISQHRLMIIDVSVTIWRITSAAGSPSHNARYIPVGIKLQTHK